jgi:hypothetical protein
MSTATAWPDDRRITIRDLQAGPQATLAGALRNLKEGGAQHYPDPAHSYT